MVDEKSREKCLKEIGLVQSLKHDNIIRYIDAFIENNELMLIFEYAEVSQIGLVSRIPGIGCVLLYLSVLGTLRALAWLCAALGGTALCRFVRWGIAMRPLHGGVSARPDATARPCSYAYRKSHIRFVIVSATRLATSSASCGRHWRRKLGLMSE